jgi:hypothetical protein
MKIKIVAAILLLLLDLAQRDSPIVHFSGA